MKRTQKVFGLAVAALILCDGPTAIGQQIDPPSQVERLSERYLDPTGGLSLEQLVTTGLEREPGLQAARTEIDAARGLVQQAGLRPNPTISSGRLEEVSGTDNQTTVGIEVPLDLFRKTGRVVTAERTLDATLHQVADRQRVLAADIRMQFGQVLAAVRTLAITEDVLELNRRTLTLLQARVAEGATPPLERNLVDVEVHRIDAKRLLQAARADTALIELKRLIGLPADAPLTIRDTLETAVRAQAPSTGWPLPNAVAGADRTDTDRVATRPDVREAQARVGVAEARIDQVRREGRFDLGLYGAYTRIDAGFPQRGVTATGDLERVRSVFHDVSVGATLMVPLRNRNQGAIAAAQFERLGAERLLAARRLMAQAELAAATARDEQARRALDIYAPGVRGLARQNVEVVRQTYELGRATLFDVLAEQRRYLDLEDAYTASLVEAFEARTVLRRALGDTQ